MDTLKKLLILGGISALVLLVVLLPVIVLTGMFGGKPLAGTIALIGLVVLAFGVAWYVRTHAQSSSHSWCMHGSTSQGFGTVQ